MSNLNGIPSADYFETTLANTWNGTTGTVYVNEVPSASIPVGEYSYIVVNPGESNMQVAKIDGWDSDNRTFNVIDVVVDSGAGTQYTAKTHPLGALVRFSNNYAFWKDIQTAVNTKADDSDISTVGKSNDYNDLDNLPTFATVATTGDYNDLSNTPTPVSIAVGDKVLELSGSNVLSATVSASYDSGTKKITLYGKNSEVISEIDCTAFIKDGMIQDVKIVTDPAGYAPGKYLEFDFNTDSGVSDIYIALSDLAVYTAGEGISISSNAISVVAATASTLGGIKVGSGLTITSGTLSADSQTDENYTTAEKTKLAGIESGAEVNDIEKVQVNGTDLPISSKTVNVKLKTINGEAISGEGDLDIMARHYTEGTGICINSSDEISISAAYQTTISCKANCSDIPTDNCQLGNGCGYTTCTGTLQSCDIACINGCCLTQGGDICIGGGGSGDMMASTYDPCNCNADAFDYCNFYNTPDLNCYQEKLTAGNNITINANTISGDFNYATSSTAAACTTKCVCIPEITQLCVGQQITVKPSETASNCATSLKLNDFTAYPIRFNNAALTSTTDGYVRGANCLTTFLFDGSYWQVASKSYDINTTYSLNVLYDAGKYTAGTGTYALSRYSLVMEKDDGTWEKITDTSAAYSTATTKTVNTNGFRLNHIRYYNTTTNVANGALIATNTLSNQAASVDLRYSTNCGGTTTWAEGDYIYLVGTIKADGLFYLDTTQWWTNQLPGSNDGKLYIRIGLCLAANGYTTSLLLDRPIFYYDGGIKEYIVADNKQDVISDLDTIRSGAAAGATAAQPGDIPTDNCQLCNSCGYTTCTGTLSSCSDITTTLGYTPANYADFETATSVGATLTVSYFTTQITPSADFTIVAGTVKEGMQYIVRVNSGATAYNMTLGTGVTNPFGEDLTLTASKMTTIVMLATSSSTLEVFSILTAE